mgnify:CR=1 FL=1
MDIESIFNVALGVALYETLSNIAKGVLMLYENRGKAEE